jgi:hypothetical protein
MQQAASATLSSAERIVLLRLARESIIAASHKQSLPQPDESEFSQNLRRLAAVFVTLYLHRELRGCTGILVAQRPLYQEVIRTAAQTALADPRFLPVRPEEVDQLEIEISVLSAPKKLSLSHPLDILNLIHPGIDGVTLFRGPYRATFLPQVWKKIPDPSRFLDMLTEKMGLPSHAWRQQGMESETYQVEEFSESDLQGNEKD